VRLCIVAVGLVPGADMLEEKSAARLFSLCCHRQKPVSVNIHPKSIR
jgi:hypothetical protein